jgi:hypothetical protein
MNYFGTATRFVKYYCIGGYYTLYVRIAAQRRVTLRSGYGMELGRDIQVQGRTISLRTHAQPDHAVAE